MTDVKRVFFGFEVAAPWPLEYPSGRILSESARHLTVAFLGNITDDAIVNALASIPLPSFSVGLSGVFDHCLFLPPRHPHVTAWRMNLGEDADRFVDYVTVLQNDLILKGLDLKQHAEFLPHVTICRSPFNPQQWKKAFFVLPCILKNLHLYESLGNMQYKSIWTHELFSPFEEIEHTADIGFTIYGESLKQLHKNATTALSFRFPELLNYQNNNHNFASLDDIIKDLNNSVTKADADIGCPLKAVSYHGSISSDQNAVLSWEMIIDV